MRPIYFIIIFFMLTLLPLFQMATRFFPSYAINENRALAPAPSLNTPVFRVPNVANEWFTDHFGLRSLLVRLKTQIDYSIFGFSDRVLIGREGWLFYRSTTKLDPLPNLTEEKRNRIIRSIQLLSEGMDRNGIKTILVINMMSDRFYGDKLPLSYPKHPDHSKIDDLVKRLKYLQSISYVDSTAILIKTMETRQVFHKTDFHWNDPAAFEVSKVIVDLISQSEGLSESVWKHPLVITTERISGGIATFMPLFIPPYEEALMVRPTFSWPPGVEFAYEKGIFDTVSTSLEKAEGFLPPVMFVGDSFLDGMVRSGLQSQFTSTYRARWKPDLKISNLAKEMPLDIKWCVIEFIELNETALDAFADVDDVNEAISILDKRKKIGNK